ncbi:PhnA protein [bacterium]|jgi:protein PhnA|nr:PhnA domain-containing protein [Balneola sp.]MBR9918929.1 PhnA protein [bacterium]
MALQEQLSNRSNSTCELCTSEDSLSVYTLPPAEEATEENSILICSNCHNQIKDPEVTDPNHWRCLNESMWSPVPAVQVMAWRMLNRLRGEGWPVELLEMMYLDEETLKWAKSSSEIIDNSEPEIKHLDSNGAELQAGDTVVLIKDLNVKGANFTAKRGTPVRNISLVYDNPEHIEGRVEGQQIVILTKFVKKQN